MGLFDRLFRKQSKREAPPMPSWEETVSVMYDKGLDAFSDEVIEVVYSFDRSMRYVILKDEKGFFTYQLEAIYQHDEEDWKYICHHALPAMWEPFRGIAGKPIFESLDELKKEMRAEPEYKQFFT